MLLCIFKNGVHCEDVFLLILCIATNCFIPHGFHACVFLTSFCYNPAAPSDYSAASEELIFTNSSSTRACIDIEIIQDGVVESIQYFDVFLNSDDISASDDAFVVIYDSDGKHKEYTLCLHINVSGKLNNVPLNRVRLLNLSSLFFLYRSNH